MSNGEKVYIVDDDEAVRDAIGMLLETVDIPYASYADKVQPVENVVVVAKSGGDYTSVQDALDNITASASNPYLIRVAPGVYTGTVDLESYVDIEGSGEGVTILRGLGGNTSPVTDGSSASE